MHCKIKTTTYCVIKTALHLFGYRVKTFLFVRVIFWQLLHSLPKCMLYFKQQTTEILSTTPRKHA